MLWTVANNSKFEKAVILSKIKFFFSKRQVHIYNMSALSVLSFKLIAKKLWMKLIIQTVHPVLAISLKFPILKWM